MLQPNQFARLNQIAWQLAGTDALKDGRVAEALSLTAEQRNRIDAIEAGYEREGLVLYRNRKGEWREKLRKLREDQNREVMQVLSDQQREKLTELKGAAF